MSHQFVVYLDEAGDDGFGKLRPHQGTGQSRWFAVGACIVSVENDLLLPSWRDDVLRAMNAKQRKDLHFRDLKGEGVKAFVCRSLSAKRVGVCVALSNKVTLLDMNRGLISRFKERDHLHNFVTRYVLERTSQCLKAVAQRRRLLNCRAKIVFSQRGGMHYDAFRDYMRLIKAGRERVFSPGKIDWDVIDPDFIDVQPHKKRAGLQFADVITSAFWKAVEPNAFGMYESRYAEELRPRVITDANGVALGTGVVHLPKLSTKSPLDAEQRAFFESWKERRQAPGP